MVPFEPQALQRRLEAVLAERANEHELSFRPMFGGITGYAHGRNFVSLSDVGLALKLDAAGRDELLREPGARPLQYGPDMPPSKSSVLVPTDVLDDDARLRAWAERSIGHCRTLALPRKKSK